MQAELANDLQGSPFVFLPSELNRLRIMSGKDWAAAMTAVARGMAEKEKAEAGSLAADEEVDHADTIQKNLAMQRECVQ